MVKWLAFWFAVLALLTSADERQTRKAIERIEVRLKPLEDQKCTLMVVLTPSGQTTVCTHQ